MLVVLNRQCSTAPHPVLHVGAERCLLRPVDHAVVDNRDGKGRVELTATVPAGQFDATFAVTIVDDSVIDGPQEATLSADVQNWVVGSATLTVQDNEHTNIAVLLPDWTGEGDGVLADAGEAVLSGSVTSAVTVSLESSDLTELTVPATVTIPAGASGATFDLTIENDADADGQQTATVTASAAGFIQGGSSVPVADDEVHHLELGPVPSPQTVAVPFAFSLRLCDVIGSNAAFAGSIDLSGAGDSGSVAVEPAAIGSLTRGEWAGMIRVDTVDANVRLRGQLGGQHAETGPFDVVPGALDHFGFAPIPSPQVAALPFEVTIWAQDANDFTVPTFTGTVALSAATIGAVGTGTDVWEYPLRTYYEDARTQVIYPADQIGQAGTITSLALDLTQVPGQTAQNWTIRMKHTSMTQYSGSPAWEGDGWTTVYQNDETFASTGWTRFEFDTPFDYNGTDSLMVDFSFNNSSWTANGLCRYTSAAQPCALYYCTDSGFGDPLAWSGTSSPNPISSTRMPNIRFEMSAAEVTPQTSAPFVDGLWTGAVTFQGGGSNITLRAVCGGAVGNSAPFHVTDYAVHTQCAVLGSMDDARESDVRHFVYTSESTLALGEDAYVATGLRFANVPVPVGAEVRAAYVQFTAAGTNSGAVALTIDGEKTPDAVAFAAVPYGITVRPRTTNSVAWNPPPWEGEGDAGSAQRTPDLKDVLQEIVSQPGWASNQAVCLVFAHSGSVGTRTAHAVDGGDPAKAAVLHVSYRPGDLDLDGDRLPDQWEIEHFGTTTNSSGQACDDFDGDGMCDYGEYYSGTDPTLSNSVLCVFSAEAVPGDGLVLRWTSVTGKTYAVREATDLLGGFSTLTNGLPATPPENAYTVTVNAANGHVYYCIQVE